MFPVQNKTVPNINMLRNFAVSKRGLQCKKLSVVQQLEPYFQTAKVTQHFIFGVVFLSLKILIAQ